MLRGLMRMKNNGMILLKTMLTATGSRNVLKYSEDARKRKRAKGEIAVKITLYTLLVAYAALMSIGYGVAGIAEAIPVTTVLTIVLISFFFTVLKTNGYLFNFKEYDMLMSMPIPIGKIVGVKFVYMYIKSLPIMVLTSVSMLVGFGIFIKPGITAYILWIILSFAVPLIPMVVASAIGALFAKIGSGMKHKTLAQTALVMVFVVFCFSIRFIIESVIRDGETTEMMTDIAGAMDSVARYYPPARWFSQSVMNGNILYTLLFLIVSVALFVIFIMIVSISYREINSALSSGSAHTAYKARKLKIRSKVRAVTFKEFRHMMGSTACLTNIGMGGLLVTILAVASFFVDADALIDKMFPGVPITVEMIAPAIPVVIYLFVGMVAWTCSSPSLEGKNYWVLQSMPISAMDVYKGKMLFNLCFFGPFMVLGTVALGIWAHAGIIDVAIYLLCGAALLIFSTCFGMRCGIKHRRLEWENEIEVIKQGSAVTSYLLPNMLVTIALLFAIVILSKLLNGRLVVLVLTLIAVILAALSYNSVQKAAAKGL